VSHPRSCYRWKQWIYSLGFWLPLFFVFPFARLQTLFRQTPNVPTEPQYRTRRSDTPTAGGSTEALRTSFRAPTLPFHPSHPQRHDGPFLLTRAMGTGEPMLRKCPTLLSHRQPLRPPTPSHHGHGEYVAPGNLTGMFPEMASQSKRCLDSLRIAKSYQNK